MTDWPQTGKGIDIANVHYYSGVKMAIGWLPTCYEQQYNWLINYH